MHKLSKVKLREMSKNLNALTSHSDPERSGHESLFPDIEQDRRIHVDADLRHRRHQQQKRRRTEHHLRQLHHQVKSLFICISFWHCSLVIYVRPFLFSHLCAICLLSRAN